jgi:hypothetical protein
LAIELKQRGFIEKIFPVIIGSSRTVGGATVPIYRDVNGPTDDPPSGVYAACDLRQEMPTNAPSVQVLAVEKKITEHLEGNCLGTPLLQGSVIDVYNSLIGYQGYFVQGDVQHSLQSLADRLVKMVHECSHSGENISVRAELCDFCPFRSNSCKTLQNRAAGSHDADSLRSQVELLQQEKVRADCVHVVCVEIGSH